MAWLSLTVLAALVAGTESFGFNPYQPQPGFAFQHGFPQHHGFQVQKEKSKRGEGGGEEGGWGLVEGGGGIWGGVRGWRTG